MRKRTHNCKTSASSTVVAELIERRLLMSTYTVNTLSDAVTPVMGQLTLRQAVADANSNAGADTINFSTSLFSTGLPQTINLTHGQLELTDTSGSTTITGPGLGSLIVSADGLSRVLQVDAGVTASVSNLSITGGSATVANNNGNTYGGGIYSLGTLSITNSNISGNSVTATGRTGNKPYSPVGNGAGGGIYATQTLVITNSIIAQNAVSNDGITTDEGSVETGGQSLGGGVYSAGPLTLTSDTLFANSVSGLGASTSGFDTGAAAGGGVYAADTVNIAGTSIDSNSVMGGNTIASFAAGPAGDASGGGLYALGAVTIANSSVNGNSVTGGGGGEDSGADGSVNGGGIYAGAGLLISTSEVSNNTATVPTGEGAPLSAGGGIYVAGVANVLQDQIENNALVGSSDYQPLAAAGGGIFAGGLLRLGQSTISGNTVTVEQADFYQFGGNAAGGGVYANYGSVTDSTISGNSVRGGKGYTQYTNYDPRAGGNASGGGIYLFGNTTITNSTLANNVAIGGDGGNAREVSGQPGGDASGGGLFDASPVAIYDSTITGNSVKGGIGGYTAYGATFTNGDNGSANGGGIDVQLGSLENTIISDNIADGSESDTLGQVNGNNNLAGVVTGASLGYNANDPTWIRNGVNGNIVGVDNPELEPLQNNGGETETMYPLPGSPVINAGSNSEIPGGVTTDQRGYARIVGPAVDIGAVEYSTASVSGYVYQDTAGAGTNLSGDTGVAGQTIYADIGNYGSYIVGDPITVTASNGSYSLYGLPAGPVIIREELQGDQRQSFPAGGGGDHVTVGSASVTNANFAVTQLTYVSGTAMANGAGLANVTISAYSTGGQTLVESTLTSSTGGFSFSNLPAGSYTFKATAPTIYQQTSPLNGSGISTTLSSGQVDQSVDFTFALVGTASPLTGTIIGTSGSYQNQGNTAAKAFDGNLSTFFDAPTASGSWAGLDLASAKVVTSISYAPRVGWASRMVGGIFQASNSATFSSGVVNMFTITTAPAAGVLTTVSVSNASAYRYVRYIGPANSYCNIAEANFFGTAPRAVTGTVIGTSGSYSNHGDTNTNAFDGSLSTFFDAPTASGSWVGLDLGVAQVVTQVEYAPRAGFANRMVGGEFQASNSAYFSTGVVTLFAISSTPVTGALTTQVLSNTTAYQFYRYIGPANSYCNIAELEFDA